MSQASREERIGVDPFAARGAVPRSEYLERRARVEALLAREGLDMLIAYSVGNQSGPAGYLAGYEPRFGQRDVSVVAVVPGGGTTLFAYAYWDRPAKHTWIDEVVVEPNLGTIASKLASVVPSSARRIGIAGYLFFPVTLASAIQAARPEAALVDASPLLMEIARIKSPAEIQILRDCARMTDAGVRAFLAGVRLGADERAIALEVERAIVMAGAQRPAFPVLIFSGSQVEVGIGFPSDRPLIAGQQINIVCGALHQGYNMDIGRVTTVGEPSRELRSVMETAAEMHGVMLKTVREGVPVDHVARAGAQLVHDRGMDDWQYRGGPPGYAGHGIGCWLDEQPTLRLGNQTPLESGMVLILEARLAKPGAGGAHITEPILVTPQGAERLGTVPIATW